MCRLSCSVVLVAAMVAACNPSSAGDGLDDTDGDGGGSAGGAEGPNQCTADSQCVPAAARCCDCPTYAMLGDPDQDICAGVTCPMPGPTCSANVHAACENQQCVLACDVMECDLSCADGFALDANGCVTCTCDAVTDRTCTQNGDCSEVAADCCGCALGGTDTAVPTADVQSYEAGLDCPSMPSCPGVSTCQTDLSPTCVQGACALQPALPADACGRPDLPACGSGEICALNSDPLDSSQGVGACIPAM
jgi:Antistasin family